MPRLILLASSPRVAPGLLSLDAWRAIETAPTVLAADLDDPLARAAIEAGVSVASTTQDGSEMATLARLLVQRAMGEDVLWLGGADGDPGLTDAIASEVSGRDRAPDVEVLVGSWDIPGARLLDVVAAMDRLRSPGGCPWDAEQTHESLAGYLLEEAYETVDAIESGDLDHLAEELGDVLLQVAFHARVAEDATEPGARFDIDDVAGHLVAKLVRRHPHVFADGDASSPDEVEQAWEQIKAHERRTALGQDADTHVLAGIPSALPAELAAAKVASRIRRRGLVVDESAHADLAQALADLAAAQEYASLALRRLGLSAHAPAVSEHALPDGGAGEAEVAGAVGVAGDGRARHG